MNEETEYMQVAERLSRVGLRPTRQRIMLGKLLFTGGHRHLTAESLHREAQEANIPVSMATIYNTLHQFTEVGLLKEVAVSGSASYFDTHTDRHHHFYCRRSGKLVDIPADQITVGDLPPPPPGCTIEGVDVIIHIN